MCSRVSCTLSRDLILAARCPVTRLQHCTSKYPALTSLYQHVIYPWQLPSEPKSPHRIKFYSPNWFQGTIFYSANKTEIETKQKVWTVGKWENIITGVFPISATPWHNVDSYHRHPIFDKILLFTSIPLSAPIETRFENDPICIDVFLFWCDARACHVCLLVISIWMSNFKKWKYRSVYVSTCWY